MAIKQIRVSDLTDEEIRGEENLARLIVEEHPDITESVTLEVLPSEIEAVLPEEHENYVRITYFPPTTSGGAPQRLIMPVEDFNALSHEKDMATVLNTALLEQQEKEQETKRRGRRTRRQTGERRRRPRIDYASPEHAGEPHRGRVTEAEKDYVRRNLPEVNERLARDGYRTIDPSDPGMAERYGLAPVPHIEEAEVVAEEVVEIEEGEEGAEEQPPRRVR